MSSTTASDTRTQILRAAWSVFEEQGAGASLADVAAAAHVSRQAVYLHFGSRAGLLLATVRHHDDETGIAQRFQTAIEAAPSGAHAARAWTETWLSYLPEVAPLARRLDAAAASDPAARDALSDRMELQRANLRRIFEWAHRDRPLRSGLTPARAADTLWSLVHVSAWHQLVVECGWSPEEFVASRVAILERALL